MTVTRTIGVLFGGLPIMLAVVMIRSESARVHFELANLEQREAALRFQLRENELEIARLKTPGRIRARIEDMRELKPRSVGKAGESRLRAGGR